MERKRRLVPHKMPLVSFVLKLALWLFFSQRNALSVLAQKRGPTTIYLVNDSEETLTAVWLNQLKVLNDELVPARSGPILPGAIEKYKAFPYDGIELHSADEGCGTKKGTAYNPQGECKTAFVQVRKADGEPPTNIIILAPNFQVTSEAVLYPNHLLKAMRDDISIDASIRIINDSGKDANLYWVNPNDKTLVAMSDQPIVKCANCGNLSWGSDNSPEIPDPKHNAPIGSHGDPYFFHASVYHQFLLKEVCAAGEDCGMRYFRVTGKEIEITISPDFDVQLRQLPYDPHAKFTYTPGVDLFQQCHDHLRHELHFEQPDKIMAHIEHCIQEHFDQVTWGFPNANLQTYLDYKMENYVCDEPRMQTSSFAEIEVWRSEQDQRLRTTFVLHKTESSQIHLLSNFVSPEECQAMEDVANTFEGTKTSDGKGGVKPNPIRKAQIARVDAPMDSPEHLATQTRNRVFDYVQHIHPTLEITPEGQEPFMLIQYQGRGRDDPQPDQYKSHCDADCNGKQVRKGQRVATVVMYCQTAEEGGHTNFRNAHVHVKPQPGNAIFFSYVNAATMEEDTGMTIHAGCPVYKGTKKIVTQWVRYGVDWENPHTDYAL